MKLILCAVLMAATLATPAFAAKVYLKDGGVIQARKVWREGGRVHVLITRDTLTSFEKSEINLKRTFPKRHRITKKVGRITPQALAAPVVAPDITTTTKTQVDAKKRMSFPKLPKLPEKTPDSLVPSSGNVGSIKQHKKEMAERIGE